MFMTSFYSSPSWHVFYSGFLKKLLCQLNGTLMVNASQVLFINSLFLILAWVCGLAGFVEDIKKFVQAFHCFKTIPPISEIIFCASCEQCRCIWLVVQFFKTHKLTGNMLVVQPVQLIANEQVHLSYLSNLIGHINLIAVCSNDDKLRVVSIGKSIEFNVHNQFDCENWLLDPRYLYVLWKICLWIVLKVFF